MLLLPLLGDNIYVIKTSSLHRSMPGLLVLFSSRVWASFREAVFACRSASSPWMSLAISAISSSVYKQIDRPSDILLKTITLCPLGKWCIHTSIKLFISYFFYLPLQLTAGLLFVVIALTKGKLCRPALRVQLILQLGDTEERNINIVTTENMTGVIDFYQRT